MLNKSVLIHHHLGLGDHIMMNGCVRHLYESNPNSTILLIVKQMHANNVDYMYRDLKNRLRLLPIAGNNEDQEVSLYLKEYAQAVHYRIGFESFYSLLNDSPDAGCDELFYKQLNMPYQYRWDKSYFKRDEEKEIEALNKVNPSGEPYIFVHDDPQRGFNLNINSNYKIVKNDPSIGLFHLFKILSEAEEVHLMESSIRCLLEDPRLTLKSNPNYHDIRGHLWLKPQTSRWSWNIIPEKGLNL